MGFLNVKPNEIENRELAAAVIKAKRLTEGSYSNYEKNKEQLLLLLARILKLSRQEKEWYVYFYAIYEKMYLAIRTYDDKAIIKYAEVYYRDCDLYMDEALYKYPNPDMTNLNIWIYGFIFDTYVNYCEIDDAKMNTFMKRYESAALKYGSTYNYIYYKAEMELAIQYRDEELMEHGRQNYELYEKDMESCYICYHKQFLAYWIMKDRTDKAEALMLDFINKNIPKRHQWCYKYCERAEAQSLYATVLAYSLDLGEPESFRYFLEKYWLAQPKDRWRQRGDTGIWYRNLSIYACAIAGNFDDLEADINEVQEDIENMKDYSTISIIEVSLKWHCYFALLDKSGIKEVPVRLPEMEQIGGNVPALAVSRYMERIADENGIKFSQARAKYDYSRIKETYLKCAGLSRTADSV